MQGSRVNGILLFSRLNHMDERGLTVIDTEACAACVGYLVSASRVVFKHGFARRVLIFRRPILLVCRWGSLMRRDSSRHINGRNPFGVVIGFPLRESKAFPTGRRSPLPFTLRHFRFLHMSYRSIWNGQSQLWASTISGTSSRHFR